jgi:hypothetical protein
MGAPAGNQNAKKAKRWQDALVKALARYANAEAQIEAGQALDKIAEQVVIKAIAGDKDAITEIGNRLDGKPAQAIIGGDDDDPPVRIARIELVALNASGSDQAS